MPGLRELDAGDASAEDDQARRHLFRRGRLAVRPRPRLREARNRRHRGIAAGRKHDRLRCLEGSPVDGDRALAGEPTAAADDDDAALLEPGQLAGVVQVVHDLVAPA